MKIMMITDQRWKGVVVLLRALEVVLLDVSLVDQVGTWGATKTSLGKKQPVPPQAVVLQAYWVERLQFPLSLKQNQQVLEHQMCLLWRTPSNIQSFTFKWMFCLSQSVSCLLLPMCWVSGMSGNQAEQYELELVCSQFCFSVGFGLIT